MTAKRERRDRSHGRILASAGRLLRRKGISGARVADVMAGAGLTVGGFYAHFGAKQALVDETLRRAGAETRERLFSGLGGRPEGERARAVLRRYLSPAHRDAASAGCPLPAVVGEIASTAPNHARALGDVVDALASRLAASLPAGRAEASRRQAAIGLVALMYGGLSLARALRGSGLSDEVLGACRAAGTALIGARARSRTREA